MAHSGKSIEKQVRVYMIVFASLMVLTFITVAISRLHLEVHQAIALGLTVALIKGTLVACFFMHLISERKFIYGTLVLTVFFFVVLFRIAGLADENEYKGIEHYHGVQSAPEANHDGSAHGETAAEEGAEKEAH